MSVNTGSKGLIILPSQENSFFDDDNLQTFPDINVSSDVNDFGQINLEDNQNIIEGVDVIHTEEPSFEKKYKNDKKQDSIKSDATIDITFEEPKKRNEFRPEKPRQEPRRESRQESRNDYRQEQRQEPRQEQRQEQRQESRQESRNDYRQESRQESRREPENSSWDFLLNPEKKKKDPVVPETFDEEERPTSPVSDYSEIRPSEPQQEQSKEYQEQPQSQDTFSDSIPLFKNEEEEKLYYLIQLKGLERRGAEPTKVYNIKSPLSEIKMEYRVQNDILQKDSSVKFYRKMLVMAATAIEKGNNYFKPSMPVDVKLDGWSTSVLENSADYDEIFEKLHKKWGRPGEQFAPEIELIMALAGSAFLFHMTNSIFKTAIPNLGHVISQKPELMTGLYGATMDAARMTQQQAQNQVPMAGPSIDLSQILRNMGVGANAPMPSNQVFDNNNFISSMNNPMPRPTSDRITEDPPLGATFRKQTESDRSRNIAQVLLQEDDNLSINSDNSDIKHVSISKLKNGKKNGRKDSIRIDL